MLARTRGRLIAATLMPLALAVALSGCGTDTGTREVSAGAAAGGTTQPPASSAAATAAPEPARSSSASVPTTPASAVPTVTARRAGFSDLLLTADEVPGVNETTAWRERSTRRREGREPFGTCHKYAMTSIGATKVATRTFSATGGSGATASHLVAEFPDGKTAWRAFEVLKSWREQCAEELSSYRDATAGRLRAVRGTDADDAGWYLLRYGPAEQDPQLTWFDAQGLTRQGNRVSVLQLRVAGQDYDYPAGGEPMVGMVRAAAARLG